MMWTEEELREMAAADAAIDAEPITAEERARSRALDRAARACGNPQAQKSRKKYLKHREEILAQKKVWYQANKEKAKAAQRQYYREHREEVLAQKKAWYHANKERISQQRRMKRRAEANGSSE